MSVSKIHRMSTDQRFTGWLGLDSRAADGKMVWGEFTPKQWEETDVDIRITHCGVCGTDMHTLRSGWVSGLALLLFPPFTSLPVDH